MRLAGCSLNYIAVSLPQYICPLDFLALHHVFMGLNERRLTRSPVVTAPAPGCYKWRLHYTRTRQDIQ